MGVLLVSGGRKVARDKNTSHLGTRFCLWMEVGGGVGREPPEHEKHIPQDAFFVFGWSVKGVESGEMAGEGGKGASV